MMKVVMFAFLAMATVPVVASAATFKNVSVVDVNCSQKVAANPDAHERTCALMCQKSGYGVITADQKFVKLDADGNAKLVKELETSQAKDHLRVDVTGDVQGDTLTVKSIKLL